MTLTADNVRVGVTGAVYVAHTGTSLPASTVATVAAFTDVGYIGEDGITQSEGAENTKIKAWQNGATVRTVQTAHDLTYKFSMLETSDATLTEYYGTLASPIVIDGDQMPSRVWVLDVIDGAEIVRIVIPDGQVTEKGDIVYRGAEATAYDITITCYPDASGNKAYIYRTA